MGANEKQPGGGRAANLSNIEKIKAESPYSTDARQKSPKENRPFFANYAIATKFGKPGLYFHGLRPSKSGDPEPFDAWVCGPIEALAASCDERGDNHGLLLRFKPARGPWRQWAVPMAMLKGSGEELRGELLSMGLRLNPNAHKRLNEWLAQAEPERHVIAATRVGWHDLEGSRAFVLPRKTIMPGNLGEKITFQAEHATDEYTAAGTLENWRQEIGILCRGNPMPVLAVSAALAGPLLHLAHRETAGIHFVGDSSCGKTTCLEAAASVWGGPDFKRTWRATGNGLEGIAAALSDTALILDEIGEADGREIGSMIYSLGNGVGKTRATRTGTAKQPQRWRLAILSSGERTLEAQMIEAEKRPNTGQAARLLNVPVQRQHGVFDTLHHLPDGRALSDHLKEAVRRCYGTLGPAFVERLVHEERDLAGEVACLAGQFDSTNPFQGRAASTLALIALAGELATEYGLTGWQKGDALEAAILAFDTWKKGQGGTQTEHQKILANVRGFLEKHGDSRFSYIEATHPVNNRTGWWRDDVNGRVYFFNREGLKEALGGFDTRRGLDALDAAGWIVERDGSARSTKLRIRGQRPRLYAIRPADEESLS
ncbi:uncharacterized protein (DUF927 family) [Halomonas ventosae]|uniref:Uncharacterized protein (DUF927 family) n=1 Tax=Halomonas ventosae TaxID=229007 RepID=A0A4R6ZDJ6_9GAMM|nr:DUF927 domain-containing protein [Halomonas ventosae]TDR50211.1 uncharacterized protein (DUF927 family) [Halomonas ventosae]